MTHPQDDATELAKLRFLRRLVTVLTATMIAGLILIVGLIVIRYMQTTTPLPDVITLPDGSKASAFTQARNWYAVVTQDGEILIFARDSGKLLKRIAVESE